jgi:hypothetical protein
MWISRAHQIALAIAVSIVAATAPAASVSTAFKLDSFGYRPGDAKVAVISANPGASVQIRDTFDTVVFQVPGDGGSILSMGNDGPASGDNVWWVDFTPFDTPGTYRLYSPSLNAQSYDFDIRGDVYTDVTRAALHSFYYQRCNTPKSTAHAGAWADGSSCHTTDSTTGPAAGHTNHGSKNLTGGWHDAGDYNKYVWSAVSTSILTMLRAYEDNPGVLRDDDTSIPESGNSLPDVLDEIKWELDWMLKMQLPAAHAVTDARQWFCFRLAAERRHQGALLPEPKRSVGCRCRRHVRSRLTDLWRRRDDRLRDDFAGGGAGCVELAAGAVAEPRDQSLGRG